LFIGLWAVGKIIRLMLLPLPNRREKKPPVKPQPPFRSGEIVDAEWEEIKK
jgi:hypothetical protein